MIWVLNIMSEGRFELHTDLVGNCFIVSNNKKFGMFDKLERKQVIRVIEELNKLDIFKNKFKRLSTDAHNYLRCYERAFEEMYDKYEIGSDEYKVLVELDELYCKYEKEV